MLVVILFNLNSLPTLPSANIGKTVYTERKKTKRERERMNGTVSSFYEVEPPKLSPLDSAVPLKKNTFLLRFCPFFYI
jgi:hypothetical protein